MAECTSNEDGRVDGRVDGRIGRSGRVGYIVETCCHLLPPFHATIARRRRVEVIGVRFLADAPHHRHDLHASHAAPTQRYVCSKVELARSDPLCGGN